MPITNARTQVGIVGAGPGGLAAAILIAAKGLSVRVYEAQPTLGGRTARIQLDDYSFDTGPTFFLMPYVLEEIFAAAGESLAKHVPMTRLDPMYRLVMGRQDADPITLDTTQRVSEMARRIGAIEPRDAAAFERFILDNRTKLRLMEPILRNPMRNPTDLLRVGPLTDLARVGLMLNPHLSVHQLLEKYFQNEHVRLAVCFQSKYLGMSPYDCPSLFTILPFIEYEYGVWHPRGGCNALIHALAKVARKIGVEIVTGSPVSAIEFDGARAKALRVGQGTGSPLSGQRIEHDHIVLNADAAWALKNLIPAEARARAGNEYADGTLDTMRYSCSTFMMYLGVEGSVDLPHHTIYTSAKYRENLNDISVNGTLSKDPSVYVCNPSRTDPTLAPTGHSSLYVLVPTPNCKPPNSSGQPGIDWSRERAEFRERALDQISTKLGLRDLRTRIRAEKIITPADWQASNIQFGATFNLAHNLGQMLHKRPQNKLRGFDNVYLVGGGTHPGSGLPTIFLSAQISAAMLGEAAGVKSSTPPSRLGAMADPVPV